MADDKKSGLIKPIIIGVSVSVLTPIILLKLGVNKSGPTQPAERTVSATEMELRERQAVLEEKIRQLSQQELNNRQTALENKVQEYEQEIDQQQPVQDVYERPSVPAIGGAWYDPNTGATYQISQTADQFTIQEFSFGVVSAVGQGSISGNSASFTYTTLMGTIGSGQVNISQAADQLACVLVDGSTGYRINMSLLRSN